MYVLWYNKYVQGVEHYEQRKRGGATVSENKFFYDAMYKERTNISQLSRKTGISRTTLTDIAKARKHNITFKKANEICEALNCSVAELFQDLI